MRPGEEWGEPTDAPADIDVEGDDQALAAVVPGVSDLPGNVPLVRFRPRGSDFARCIGLGDALEPTGIAVPVDAITTDVGLAMNAVVLGTAPGALHPWTRRRRVTVTVDDRAVFAGGATTVVIANGQFLADADVVPRGHPGDGRLEVQVYALDAGERAPMRRRLASGTHVPHPRITTASGRVVRVTVAGRGLSVQLDRGAVGRHSSLTASVRHPALRLLL